MVFMKLLGLKSAMVVLLVSFYCMLLLFQIMLNLMLMVMIWSISFMAVDLCNRNFKEIW